MDNAIATFGISAFWMLLEILYSYLFLSTFLSHRVNRMHCFLTYFLFWIVMILLPYAVSDHIPIIFLFYPILLTTSLFLFQGNFLTHILISLLCVLILGISDTVFPYGMCSLLSISFEDLSAKRLTFLVIVTLGKLFNFLIAWLIHRFRKAGQPQDIQPQWVFLSLLFPLVSFIMLFIVFSSFQNRDDLPKSVFVLSIAISIANLAIIYLVGLMEKSTKVKHELSLLNQQMEIQAQSILALEKSYRAHRTAAHEFSHRMQTIDDLLSKGEYVEARKYVKQIQGIQTTRVFGINSRHPIIDAILNSKYQTAKENGIDMQVHVNDLSTVSLPRDALVVLLANLLDNAIEACQRYPDVKVIHCTLLAEDSLFLSIDNTTLPVEIVDNKIASSKGSTNEHGYGLTNVQHILHMLNAEFTFSYSDGWFRFVAEIPAE